MEKIALFLNSKAYYKISIVEYQCLPCRSSRSQIFSKKGILKIYAIFPGKHLRWSLALIKLQAFKKRLQERCFPVNIVKFLRKAFLIEHFRWLFLPVTTTFRNRYWEDLLVILFTLTHNRKSRSRSEIYLKLKVMTSRKETVKIKASQ